jgi:hypothetical protein
LTVFATEACAGRSGGQRVLGAGGDRTRVVGGEDRLAGLVEHRAALDLEPLGEDGVGDVALLRERPELARHEGRGVEEPVDGLDVTGQDGDAGG